MIKVIKEGKFSNYFKKDLPDEEKRLLKMKFDLGIEGEITKNPDGSIDVDGNVNMGNKNLNEIPIKFNRVTKDFICSDNNLISLKNCPAWIGGYFNCSGNMISSLEGCPEEVMGSFYCSRQFVHGHNPFHIWKIDSVCKVNGKIEAS